MPAAVFHIRVFFKKLTGDDVDFFFDFIAVYHRIPFMLFFRDRIVMMMDHAVASVLIAVVCNGMKKNIESRPFLTGDGNNGNAEHFGKSVQVEFHASFLHNVHHIQGHNNGFSEFKQLQRQI